jgi:hypothetical protein
VKLDGQSCGRLGQFKDVLGYAMWQHKMIGSCGGPCDIKNRVSREARRGCSGERARVYLHFTFKMAHSGYVCSLLLNSSSPLLI